MLTAVAAPHLFFPLGAILPMLIQTTRRLASLRSFSLLILAALALLALPAMGEEAVAEVVADENKKSLVAFFGRMHILVLHLPIGILLGAFIVEVLGFFKRSKGYDIAAMLFFVLGAGAAVFTVIFGLMWENARTESSLTQDWHKWLGISVGVIAIAGAVCKVLAVKKQWGGEERASGGSVLIVARVSLILLATLLLPITGHLGGNMARTNTFLTENSPITVPEFIVHFPNKPPVVIQAAEGSLEARWVSEVQPLLNTRCISCHGPDKQSSDLRLDSLELALAWRGEDGEEVALVPGSAFDSLIYRMSSLPIDDEYRMPTSRREGFTPEELAVLGNWLVDAANLGHESPSGNAADGTGEAANNEPTFDQAAADKVIAMGGRAVPISINSTNMEVSFANMKPLPDAALASLDAAADNIEKLYLQMSGVTDAGLANLPDMNNLVHLNLKDTAIADAGLANLPEMFSIEEINLFGTGITDAGLKHLENYDTLDDIYLTGTAVTEEGVKALREALPETHIYSDFDDEFSLAVPGAEPDNTTPVNTTCPVTDQPVKAEHTVVHEGRVIGFCCPNCPATFVANPAQFADKLPAP